MVWLAIVVMLACLGLVAEIRRRLRLNALAGLRRDWGRPVVRTRRTDAIVANHQARVLATRAPVALDDRTAEDIDLNDVFAALDRTESTLGQHALYHRLRSEHRADNLAAFERLVTRFTLDGAARERAQLALGRLQDPHGYDLWWLGRPGSIDSRPWFALFPILGALSFLLLAASPFWPQLFLPFVAALAANVGVRYLTDRRIGHVAGAFRQLAPVIAAGESLVFLSSDDLEPLLRSFRADAHRLGRLKTIARWTSRDPFMLAIRPGAGTLLVNDVANAVYEYLNLAFLLDGNGVYFGSRELREQATALLRLTAAAGEIDAAISVASVRAGRNDWTRPQFMPAAAPAVMTNVRHPLVRDAVPNSGTFHPGQGMLITGSNMSGKSTFLRTIGVATVMAQTLNTCFASEYHAPRFTLRSCIGRADDLLTGKSYYIAEVEALLGLVDASASAAPHLFLLDELFRGTNTVERIAAGHAILLELVASGNGSKPHVVLAATHEGELVDLLSAAYVAYHFGDAVGPEGLVFDHRLRPGRALTRNAIALLRLHGAPEGLVERALACAATIDGQRGTSVIGR